MQNIEPIIIAVVVGVAAYVALIAVLPKRFLAESTQYTRDLLQKLSREKPMDIDDLDDHLSLLRSQRHSDDWLSRIFFKLPGTNFIYPKLLKAGMAEKVGGFFIRCLLVLVVVAVIAKKFFPMSILVAVIIAYGYGLWSINRQIAKRNAAFLNSFPDALDMIVRSVRSGYPMNSAVRMVADNMQPPVSTEFKQVADEIAYGSTLIEALQRLIQRIDEPDVHFFVVVLTVQQDIGGNLSEVLNNLAGIIRKRKHLRMKIKAISSEGRTTAWVLGSMPVVEAALISVVNPDHLTPLFNTSVGNTMLAATVAVISLGVFVVRQMVNIKV